MNFAQLQARAAQLIKLEGWADVSPAPDWAAIVNRALYLFSWEGEYKTSTDSSLSTVSGTSDVNLTTPPDWKRVTDVILADTDSLLITDENTIRAISPTWLVTPNGRPTHCFLSSPNTLRLWPTPDATYTLDIRGSVTESALSAATDTPDLAEPFHEGVALLAAYLHGKSYAKGDGATRLDAYYAQAQDYIARLKLYQTEQGAANFQRRQSRRGQEYLSLI